MCKVKTPGRVRIVSHGTPCTAPKRAPKPRPERCPLKENALFWVILFVILFLPHMPKKVVASSGDQDELIEKIRGILFGDRNTCILYDMDHNAAVQQQILELIPSLRSHFLIHNIPGVQRPQSLKRPWLSIMRAFLKKKYHILCENYICKRPEGNVATKRYVLLPKDSIVEFSSASSPAEEEAP